MSDSGEYPLHGDGENADYRLKYRLVWVNSMPRSGSMWAYNVARTILGSGERCVLPDLIPAHDNEIAELAYRALSEESEINCVYCLKMDHSLIKPLPLSLFVTTYRDIRDSLISLMRFTKYDFPTALEKARAMMALADYYAQFDDRICLKLRYDDIVERPKEQVKKMSEFFQILLTTNQVSDISKKWNRENVKKMVQDVGLAVQNDAVGGAGKHSTIPVFNADGTTRIFDRHTGFQSDHVSSSSGGEWRDLLTAEQKQKLHLVVGDWLERYGFDID